MDLAGTIAIASQTIGLVKTIKDIDASFDKAQFKAQVADLLSNLADVKTSLIDADESLRAKDLEIERLKRAFEDRSTLSVGPGGYKYRSEEGEQIGYPVCPRCEQVDGRLAQLFRDEQVDRARCPVCTSIFKPVTCFMPPDAYGKRETAQQREFREQAEGLERLNRRLAEHGGVLLDP